MKEILEKYLIEQAEKDSAFAEKFDASKMNSCVSFVVSQARTYLKGHNGAVEDTIVFKWARDFFNDGKSETAAKDKPKPTEKPVKTWAEAKAELEAKKHPAPKAKKTEPKEEGPKQLLFDFMGE